MSINYEPGPGQHILEAVTEMVTLANARGESVIASFNDIPLLAHPGDAPETIVESFYAEMKRQREAYLASPEYAERQRQAQEAQQQKERALAEGLATAGPLKLSDPAAWQSWVEANTDPYGSACVRYAELWGRLMQVRIARGENLDQCAEETSHIANTDGITGFMYGCAVGMLAKAWEYGEQLRRWHNLKHQIQHEGEEANKTGGVLNPALLTIGK